MTAEKHNRTGADAAREARPRPGHKPRLSLERTALEPGAAVAPSVPLDDERAIYFLEGEGEADIDGRPSRVEAGDTLRLQPGARFGVRNTGRAALVFVTAAPPPLAAPAAEGPLALLAGRISWVLRRVARRLDR